MQNVGVKELKNWSLNSKFEKSVLQKDSLIISIVYVVAGMVTSLAKIMGMLSPLGIAFTSAIPSNFALPCSIGTAIGYLLCGQIDKTYRFAVVSIIIGLARYFLGKTFFSKYDTYMVPTFAVLGVVAAYVLPNIYTQPLIYDIIIWVAQIILAGASSLFFIKTVNFISSANTDSAGSISFSIAYIIAIMGLCSVNIYNISIGRISAFLGILISATVGGVAVSAIIGVLSGFAIGFSGNDISSYMTVCSIGGILSGLFANFGKIGSSFTLAVACGFMGAYTGKLQEYLIEVAVATLVFIIIPKSWLKMLVSINKKDDSKDFQLLAEEKLLKAAQGLTEVTDITNELAERLDGLQKIDINSIYDKTALNICQNCPYCLRCWQKNFDDTVDSISFALHEAKKKNIVTENDFPDKFVYCIKKKEMSEFITKEYLKYSAISKNKIKAERTRNIVNKQINSIANILTDISMSINDISFADEMKRASIEEMLTENNFEPLHVSCCTNKNGKLKVIVYIPFYKEGSMTPQLICTELSLLLMRNFTYPTVENNKNHCVLTFCEETTYTCKYGVYQKSLKDNVACGDSYTIFTQEHTKLNIVLSDGMGTGSNAAVDSKLTISLIKKLINSGISYPNITNIVNSQLMVKSGNESTSTIDGVQVDLYTGEMSLYKAGAAPTIIYRRGKIIMLDASSLPVGILDTATINEQKYILEENDILILMSDGVIIEDNEWITTVIENNINESLETMSENIGKTAMLRRNDGREDDVTVICCKICKADRDCNNREENFTEQGA